MNESQKTVPSGAHWEIFEQIWQAYSGDAAWQVVADLSRFHRIQASPGYRQAAHLLHQRLVQDGLQAQILSYPADERTTFWARRSFQEWDCTGATLHLVAPEGEARLLADFRACPISLIQRSTSFEGQAEVVLLEDGEEQGDYDGLEIAGKVVLSQGDLRRVWELAVEQRGAAGILFDGMRHVDPVRPKGDLPDVRQYTSFWWQPGDTRCFGFVLTPRQGQALRQLLKNSHDPVRVQARVTSRLYDGAMEVVQADIPGESQDRVLVVAHLCHPQPSANDNASGAAAALEAARTLQSLIASGALPRPKRTIRFLWMPEITGMHAYVAGLEEDLERFVAGINLDMVGEDQDQTGSVWLIERPPDAAASFAPELLARLRAEMPALKGMTGVAPSHTGIGAYPLYRQAEVPFSGGSDHIVLSDPTVGIPTPMLIQWPDRFYHTSADTPDRTDPRSLAQAGSLAAIYAYWLAAAGPQEVTWLGYEMVARFKTQAVEAARSAATEALALADGESLAQAMAGLDRRLAYLLDRQKAALGTLQRLASIGCPVEDLQAEAVRAAHRELAWAKSAIDLRATTLGLESLPQLQPQDLSEEEQQAARLIPVRQVRGPVSLSDHLRGLDEETQQGWRQLLQAHKDSAWYTLTPLALYWADGARSVLGIAGLVELESGQRDVELTLAYFQLLEKLGFVTLKRT
jgi:aminopeptidase YwaD